MLTAPGSLYARCVISSTRRGISARFHICLIETDVGDWLPARGSAAIFNDYRSPIGFAQGAYRSIDRSIDRRDVGRKHTIRFREGASRRNVVREEKCRFIYLRSGRVSVLVVHACEHQRRSLRIIKSRNERKILSCGGMRLRRYVPSRWLCSRHIDCVQTIVYFSTERKYEARNIRNYLYNFRRVDR